ncbi:DegT/DnrJ/EryC1/StrS family aminotransferase [Streptomyces sp. NPDC002285]
MAGESFAGQRNGATVIHRNEDGMREMPSQIISDEVGGDSRSLYGLVNDVRQGRENRYRVADTLANRKLASLLTTDASRLNPAHPLSVFAGGSPVTLPVPFLPKERLLTSEEKEIAVECFARALNQGDLTSGPAVSLFETAIAEFLAIPHVIGTSSGTDAMILALHAAGVEAGSEVIMPANSFAATENAVFACGAIPVLVDINADDGTIDPNRVEASISPLTRAILPVHLYGKMADMATLRQIADSHGLLLIEDACQAIGVTGVGQYSDAAILSFNPYKNFGLCGKSGAVITADSHLAERCRKLSYHGFEKGSKNIKAEIFGYNSRIDNVTAEVALGLLPNLTLNSYRRAFMAARYIDSLSDLARGGMVHLPAFTDDHSWHLFTVRLGDASARDRVQRTMRDRHSVDTDIYYPVLTHQQQTPLHQQLFREAKLGNTERLNSRLLHLPLFNNMSIAEHDRVVEALYDAVRSFE